ncbi:hypothetical protein GETHLI_05550 [Geothrix limicola]|uniref:Uncharacterized protein n=1 Tax=Geothrix limicola TaxID=2927978 RepID=A0ABQ5QBK0_9BACT|nr:hypothetical protein [Geothrix limicola]GLH72053.1 hypothetical protein GETHLI_05550 [Geothrix limicola]
MNELDRLRAKKRRRQAALQQIGEMEDRLQILKNSFQEIRTRALTLQIRYSRFIPDAIRFRATSKESLLKEISEISEKDALLDEIAGGLDSIRSEFLTLARTDEAELQELDALLKSQLKEDS